MSLTIQVRTSLVTSDHSGRANAAEKVSDMHNTKGLKAREVAAYITISDSAFSVSDTHTLLPSLGHGRPTFHSKELAVSRDPSGRITISTVHHITCHEGIEKE